MNENGYEPADLYLEIRVIIKLYIIFYRYLKRNKI